MMRSLIHKQLASMQLLVLLLALPSLSYAGSNIPDAYKQIADEYSIPPVLLYSMALTESFHADVKRPWPWTINCNGTGRYFDSRTEAFNFVAAKLAKGIRNCDIGIMQVSWRWNKHVFESLWAAFDPYTNIRAGAEILSGLYHKHGAYEIAVGAYHSPSNAARASAYRERVRSKLKRVLTGVV